MSSSEARRLIKQGGVKVDGDTLDPTALDVPAAELEGVFYRSASGASHAWPSHGKRPLATRTLSAILRSRFRAVRRVLQSPCASRRAVFEN